MNRREHVVVSQFPRQKATVTEMDGWRRGWGLKRQKSDTIAYKRTRQTTEQNTKQYKPDITKQYLSAVKIAYKRTRLDEGGRQEACP